MATPHRQPNARGENPRDIGAHHRDRALREVGGTGGLVDEDDAERDKAVHRADKRPGQCELCQQLEIHGYPTSQIANTRLIVPVCPLS